MTGYTVLKFDTELGAWVEIDQLEADNAERAERQVVATNGEGTYVAVPDRSWKPSSYESKVQVVRSKIESIPE
jgi:hypothetical protein